MTDEGRDKPRREPHTFHVKLPGFIREDEVGLGDVIKSLTTRFGVRPCGGCERRAAALNERIRFGRRRS